MRASNGRGAVIHRGSRLLAAGLLCWASAAPVLAQDAAGLLGRAAEAARTLDYVGTIVFQSGAAVETARIIHVNDNGEEFEKLVALDGPAREVIRQKGEVRCYYPDAKLVRIEPRTFRNAFPSLSPQQQEALARYYVLRKGAAGRGKHAPQQVASVHDVPLDDSSGWSLWAGLAFKGRQWPLSVFDTVQGLY